ncbi:hypothetical protein CIPAW_05G234700 [Carya illinoinensis]|uniref:Uncharacterized protein n=1 Tax=Carya illinoinensis TaxID=32201 RepID=A0A8T1QNM4_CARIL|nr:hypothetical protein CIPAW_05G234700 [Carya illinoinensis]
MMFEALNNCYVPYMSVIELEQEVTSNFICLIVI